MIGSLLGGVVLNGINNTMQEGSQGRLNENAARLNYEYGQKASENAYKRQEEWYNKYQSPSALKKQYEEAGLNPSLLYGGAMGVGQASAVGGNTAGASINGGQAASRLGETIGSLLNARVSQAQARSLNADAERQEIENKTLASEFDKNYKADTSYKIAGADNLRSESILNEAKVNQVLANTASEEARKALLEAQKTTQDLQNSLLDMEVSISKGTFAQQFEARCQTLKRAEWDTLKAYYEMKESKSGAEHADEYLEAQISELKASRDYMIECKLREELGNKLTKEEYESLAKSIRAAATKAEADSKNAEEFKERFETEMKFANKELWVKAGASVLGSIAGTAASLYNGTAARNLTREFRKK